VNTDDRAAADSRRFAEWALKAKQAGDSPAIPAATVVVLRDTPAGPATLMLRKNSRIAFGGMWVFPGGRIDLDDQSADPLDEIAAARTAAAREAMEEATVEVDPQDMVLFSHWLPPAIAPRRYSTWFFAAAVESSSVTIDDGEIVDNEWMTPEAALERHHQGEIELVPPTWVTLHTISGFDTVDAVLTSLRDRPARHHETHIAFTDSGPVALWEGDAGYQASDASVGGSRHRLEMLASGYIFDDSGAAG